MCFACIVLQEDLIHQMDVLNPQVSWPILFPVLSFYWSCRRDANQISSDRRNSQYKHVVTRRNAAFLLDWFCNPFLQTCRTLLDKLALDGHLHVRVFEEPMPTAPTMLRALFKQDPSKEPPSCRNRYFANPMSTSQL